MADNFPASLGSVFDLLLDLNESIYYGEPFILNNEAVARELSSILSEYYPDHLFIAADGFQAICVTQKQAYNLIEQLQKRISSLLSRASFFENQIDFIDRRILTLPKI